MRWKCYVPGKPKTDWEGGFFPITMEFPEEYPTKPPKASCTAWPQYAVGMAAWGGRGRRGPQSQAVALLC